MDVKERIIGILNKKEWFPTSKIASLLGLNYYVIQRGLSELKDDGKIEQNETPAGVYWRKI